MNNSRFKFFLIDNAHLSSEAEVLSERIGRLFLQFDRAELSKPELVFLVIATICEHRKSGAWWMRGKCDLEFPQIDNEKFSIALQELRVPFKGDSLGGFFKEFRLKNLPQAVARVLNLWMKDQIQLKLVESVVTPMEMLALQAQGQRVVTLSRNNLLQGTLVDGRRDGLEFLLHDLTHANLFFSLQYEEQKYFFSSLEKILANHQNDFDNKFNAAIEYIISDMNSSKHHLAQSLKAAAIDHEKRIKGIARLNLIEEESLRQSWGHLW